MDEVTYHYQNKKFLLIVSLRNELHDIVTSMAHVKYGFRFNFYLPILTVSPSGRTSNTSE